MYPITPQAWRLCENIHLVKVKVTHMKSTRVKVLKCPAMNILNYQKYQKK